MLSHVGAYVRIVVDQHDAWSSASRCKRFTLSQPRRHFGRDFDASEACTYDDYRPLARARAGL
jgi:hypothetical protein